MRVIVDFQISKAQETDVQQVAHLFDQYRQFYGQQTDTSLAEYFIKSRMLENNTFIFVAKDCDNNLCGFCLVYLKYSSILAKRIFLLNDLYVAEPYRSAGIGKALVQKVVSIARIEGVKKLNCKQLSKIKLQKIYMKVWVLNVMNNS